MSRTKKWRSQLNNTLDRHIHYTELPKIQYSCDRKKISQIFGIDFNDAVFAHDFVIRIINTYLWKDKPLAKKMRECFKFAIQSSNVLNEDNLYEMLRQLYQSSNTLSKTINGNEAKLRATNRVKSIGKTLKYSKFSKATCYLDIGSFDGHITQAVGEYFHLERQQIHGVDIRNFNKVDITFTECEDFATHLPYSDSSFDLITCLMTLHHIPSDKLDTLMGEIYRVMKYDGIVILREHSVEHECSRIGLDIMHKFYDKVWNMPDDSWSEEKGNYKSFREWNQLFIKHGFSVDVRAKPYANIHKNPYYSYICTYSKTRKYELPSKLFRILSDDFPREKYRRRTSEFKSVLHWGQRKLLLSEIEFLCLYLKKHSETINGEPNPNAHNYNPLHVIYAGSAPGTHIAYLSQLFPRVHFELYDPREFSDVLDDNEMIRTHVQYFTDETANEWIAENHPNKTILLISDIRTGDTQTMTPDEVEERVRIDHEWQKNWYDIMHPEMSMFKFRLPWNDGNMEYLDGNIYLQAYPPCTSTETRLIVGKNASCKIYDNRKYEEQLFYFNNHIRVKQYDNILENIPSKLKHGLTNTYDSAAEIHILREYLRLVEYDKTIDRKIIRMCGQISKALSQWRTLYSNQPVKEHKRKLLKKLQLAGYIPANVKLNQNTFNLYVIPRYEWFVSQKLIEQ